MVWKIVIALAVGAVLVFVFIFQTELSIAPASPDEKLSKLIAESSTLSDTNLAFTETLPLVHTFPEMPVQGDPVKIVFENIGENIEKVSFENQSLNLFSYNGKLTAFIGLDLNHIPGIYTLAIELIDGYMFTKEFAFSEREKREEPLGIPEKLGGNTSESEQKLLATLASENAELAAIQTEPNALFTEPFAWPLKIVEVTDEYGYVRKTVNSSIAHKGTDFRAAIGTNVFSANNGVVRISKEYRNYGNTIAIDHGAGIMSFYMHLSKRSVNVGDVIERGEPIGLSGDTGYAESPHLHLTVRVNGVSIDPIAFFELF